MCNDETINCFVIVSSMVIELEGSRSLFLYTYDKRN